MGQRGTDVAREAADLVLLDDRFASIVAGIDEGRRIFVNLRMALTYLVVAHVPIAGLALFPVLLGIAPILFPMQVVVLELIIDPMCALVFEGRPSARGAMDRPPRRAGEPLFGSARLATALAQGALLLAVVFGFHLILLDRGVAEPAARAATLVALVSAYVSVAAVLGTARGDLRPRPAFLLIVAAAVTMLGAGIAIPWLARMFQFLAPSPGVLIASVALGIVAGLAGALLVRRLGHAARGAVTSAPAP
jgi:Ca2+-transporting ATPase